MLLLYHLQRWYPWSMQQEKEHADVKPSTECFVLEVIYVTSAQNSLTRDRRMLPSNYSSAWECNFPHSPRGNRELDEEKLLEVSTPSCKILT